MSLVDSLLGAIIKLEGDSLVLHTGEKPYVVTSVNSLHAYRGPLAWGQVELSTRTLTAPAVMSILEQLLDREQLHALEEMGAIEHYLPERPDRPSFQVVAARGGDDIWVEVRPVRPAAATAVAPDSAADDAVAAHPPGAPSDEAAPAGPRIEVVHEIEQEQPDANEVAALVASSGLGSGGHAAAAPKPEGEPSARGGGSALLENEERRLAAAREEAARAETHAREEVERLAALREEASRLERERQEAAAAAAAAREQAERLAADARAAAESLEHATRDEAARLQAARDELARVQQAKEESVRAQESRLDALRGEALAAEAAAKEEAARVETLRAEAARLEAARAEAERAEAAAREEAARVDTLRAEAARLQAARAEAERAEAAAREEAARVETLRAEAARLEAARAEAERAEAAAREEAARVETLRAEAARLEAARAEAERAEAAAREEAARVETLRAEAARLEAARVEAERVEAAAREEAARVETLRAEAARLEAARAEAERAEAAAREEAARVEALRQEAAQLETARAEAAAVEAAAREEAVRLARLREEAERLEAAREDAARVEAIARAEAERIEALRREAAELEAARAEAARAEEAARLEAARVAESILAQGATLERAQQEIEALRAAIRAETEQLEAARSTAAQAEEARQQAEREEQERVEALREAQRLEESRLEGLRAQTARLETARREQQAAADAAREQARSVEVARQGGEERLAALLAALRDDTGSRSVPTRVPRLQATTPAESVPLSLPPTHDEAATERTGDGRPFEREAITTPEPQPAAGLRPETISAAPPAAESAPLDPAPEPSEAEDARPAHVLPLVRGVREQPSVSPPVGAAPDLDRLLRIAAARGASGLYLVSRSHPSVRVDGDMQALESEEPLAAADVEAFMLALVPEPSRDSVKSGATVEWFCDVPEIGRVRCFSFRDHRGPGVIIRMLPARAASAEQLGLSREIQALTSQPDGLVLIAGPRASGKSTMLAAFIDLINRTRADHVITIERQVTVVHESQRAFVSQREVRGEAHEVLTAVRAALREDPDVLVVEELRSPEVVSAVLESSESGRLVIAGIRAPASAQALERLMKQVPADRRPEALSALSTSLRGVVSQVLLRRRTGGRIAARELLLNTPAAAAVLADGKLFQLGAAIESGRKLGSVPLNDSLVGLVRDAVVDPREAWRKAYDREGLLTLMKREGMDTSFVEKLA